MSELPFLPPYLLLVQETQERLRCSLVPNSLAVRTARCTYSSDLERLRCSEERLVLRDKGFFCLLAFFVLIFTCSFILHVYIASNSIYFKFRGKSELVVS